MGVIERGLCFVGRCAYTITYPARARLVIGQMGDKATIVFSDLEIVQHHIFFLSFSLIPSQENIHIMALSKRTIVSALSALVGLTLLANYPCL